MMMQMMRPRASTAETEVFMHFKPDAALKATVTQLPREIAALAAPDIGVCGRLADLRARSDDGHDGNDGNDMSGDERVWLVPPAALRAGPTTTMKAHLR